MVVPDLMTNKQILHTSPTKHGVQIKIYNKSYNNNNTILLRYTITLHYKWQRKDFK